MGFVRKTIPATEQEQERNVFPSPDFAHRPVVKVIAIVRGGSSANKENANPNVKLIQTVRQPNLDVWEENAPPRGHVFAIWIAWRVKCAKTKNANLPANHVQKTVNAPLEKNVCKAIVHWQHLALATMIVRPTTPANRVFVSAAAHNVNRVPRKVARVPVEALVPKLAMPRANGEPVKIAGATTKSVPPVKRKNVPVREVPMAHRFVPATAHVGRHVNVEEAVRPDRPKLALVAVARVEPKLAIKTAFGEPARDVVVVPATAFRDRPKPAFVREDRRVSKLAPATAPNGTPANATVLPYVHQEQPNNAFVLEAPKVPRPVPTTEPAGKHVSVAAVPPATKPPNSPMQAVRRLANAKPTANVRPTRSVYVAFVRPNNRVEQVVVVSLFQPFPDGGW